ncbi:MAG: NAD-dependent protein deacetylase [Clostridia bacterium]|nr:NAD-dependent protein deacetylase [Clostridia bacterium]
MDSQIQELKELIDKSRNTVVITGAGVSMSSGIGDVEHWNLGTVLQMSSVTLLKLAPKRYYKAVWKSFLNPIFNNGANITHKKLAELEKENKIQGIITTNIDHLHKLAGSKNVAEIQGSFAVNKCLKCNKRYNDIHIWNNGKVPKCECGGVIGAFPVYAHVGQLIPEAEKARKWIELAELIIVIGANGSYYWSYGNHIKPNAKIVQINPKSTFFDNKSILNIRKKSDEVFSEL